MKGLYIAPVDSTSNEFIGVFKKIQSQISAFKNQDVDMDYIGIEKDCMDFIGNKESINLKRAKHYVFFRYILKNVDKILNKYDFVYIRFSFANPYMFKLAKKLIKTNTKVFIEIPTYPYDSEIKNNIKNIILKKVDKLLWIIKGRWVTKLVLTNDRKKLFGVDTINIFNGININDINEIEKDLATDEINLIGVANVSKWHGYDRIISGMAEYYKGTPKRKVNFFIVGEGAEKSNLENLTDKLILKEKVFFLGAKFSKELEEIYSKMDIGVSSLALFRAGGGHDPIKSKEYVAKGIPVVIGYNDRALSNELPFVFSVSSDDSAININEIVGKYINMKISSKEIRDYAYMNLSWESQMKKVIDELDNANC